MENQNQPNQPNASVPNTSTGPSSPSPSLNPIPSNVQQPTEQSAQNAINQKPNVQNRFNKKVIIFIVIGILLIIAIGYFLWNTFIKVTSVGPETTLPTPIGTPLTLNDEEIIRMIRKLPKAENVEFVETEGEDYPWGSVRIFSGKTESGDDIVIDIKSDEYYITGYSIYGKIPSEVIIDYDSALESAKSFLSKYVPEINFSELELEGESPSKDSTIKVYRFQWQKITSSGAAIPPRLIVYINAETNQVDSYIRIDYKIAIDTNPRISKEKAIDILGIDESALYGDPVLGVLPSDGNKKQILAWMFTIDTSYEIGEMTMTPPLITVYINAHSGKVLSDYPEEN